MTKVHLEQTGQMFTVSAKGHSTGSVEMCAAVSCLMYTLAGYVDSIDCDHIIRLNDGDAHIRWIGDEMSEPIFDLICIGFAQLEKTDPDHIQVTLSVESESN